MTVRVRKARRSGRLGCGHWVSVGHLIASHGKSWRCIECALAAVRARAPEAEVHPGRGDQGQEAGR